MSDFVSRKLIVVAIFSAAGYNLLDKNFCNKFLGQNDERGIAIRAVTCDNLSKFCLVMVIDVF